MRTRDDLRVHPERADRTRLLDEDPAAFDPRSNPCVDFGRMEEAVPALVLTPRDREALCRTLARLAAHQLPYKLRGTAHSSGGQTLYAGGVVVELRRLDAILEDDPAAETITVEGGSRWDTVATTLARSGRRVPVLTDNLHTTVAGTLGVGGFGDATHAFGLQADNVARLTLATPDGRLLEVGPADEQFRFALCGLGQLGAIVAATLRTHRRAATLAARAFRFADLASYVHDLSAIMREQAWDIVRARLVWHAGGPPYVEALGGRLTDEPPALGAIDRALLHISPVAMSAVERVPFLDLVRRSQVEIDALAQAVPALELALPLPEGLAIWERLRPRIEELGLPAAMPRGAAIAIAPRSDLPWAPLHPTPTSLLVALRPRMGPSAARALAPALARLADDIVAAGGRIYLMSTEAIAPARIARQVGDAYARMRELKHAVDPANLCNRGVFEAV